MGAKQDKTIGRKILSFIKKGDLVLRDMGYFAHSMFEEIEALKGDWLSRLPANVNVLLQDDSKLEKKLKSRSNNMINEEVIVGSEGLDCRMVALRADNQLARKRRRIRKKPCKNTPSQQALTRDGRHILLTSLDKKISKEELFEIYKLRWNVEVRCKAWKQAINMKSLFKTVRNYAHQRALIYAALIFQLITLNVASRLSIGDRVLSLENFSSEIATQLLANTNLTEPLEFRFNSRHILMEKRKRKPLIQQLLTT